MAEVLAHPTWHAHINRWGGDAVVIIRLSGETGFTVSLDMPSVLTPGQDVSERVKWLDEFDQHADALAFATAAAERRGIPFVDLPTARGEV